MDSLNIQQPTDLIANCMNEQVYIKCRNSRILKGKLIAFDTHLNLMIQDAEETSLEEDGENGKPKVQVKRKFPMLYMRGDAIILISPLQGVQ